jgi:hypothetical protein
MTTTPNCCANCVRCSLIPLQKVGAYLGGDKYWCSQFQTVVVPYDENCKVHERYVARKGKDKLIKDSRQ